MLRSKSRLSKLQQKLKCYQFFNKIWNSEHRINIPHYSARKKSKFRTIPHAALSPHLPHKMRNSARQTKLIDCGRYRQIAITIILFEKEYVKIINY